MGSKNQARIGLSYRPALVPGNRFLDSLIKKAVGCYCQISELAFCGLARIFCGLKSKLALSTSVKA